MCMLCVLRSMPTWVLFIDLWIHGENASMVRRAIIIIIDCLRLALERIPLPARCRVSVMCEMCAPLSRV